ncbi:MAG: adenosylcobinamide-phosphate synthase CbiB [Mariprofundaceae bacterium]|nr:adenosylcobinamide-phosphate synthase CbiB [Mariprofundaceae bacterium]
MLSDAPNGLLLLIFAWAMLLEWWVAEPSNRWHPVAWFGACAMYAERVAYGDSRCNGLVAWSAVVSFCLLVCHALHALGWGWDVLLLWLSIGWSSLFSHVQAVVQARSIEQSRAAVSRIVSRDCTAMTREQSHRAALESLAENGSDAVIAPLFWFLVAGVEGAVLYRMINTLDAMWGYRHAHYRQFGWWAAKVDDGANYIPARITAALFLLVSGGYVCLHTLAAQARMHASPNAGWPEAALAHAACVRLGGAVMRRGVVDERPDYGTVVARPADDTQAVADALRCVRHALIMGGLLLAGVLWYGI